LAKQGPNIFHSVTSGFVLYSFIDKLITITNLSHRAQKLVCKESDVSKSSADRVREDMT